MALRWLEGFEGYTTDIDTLGRIYTLTGTSVNAETGASNDSGNAITSGLIVLETPVLVSSEQDTWVAGIAFRGDRNGDINDPDIPFVSFSNSSGEQIRFEFLQVDPASEKPGGRYFTIRVMRGATELATSTDLFAYENNRDDLWVYLELKVTIDNSTGAFSGQYSLCRKPSVNGGSATTMSWDAANTSVDTQNQASTGADRATISLNAGDSQATSAIDDIYILDDTGSKNNDFLGRIVIEGQKPSGDGTTTDWELAGSASSTEDAWNEPLTSSEDDKRLTCDTTNDVHLCTMASLSQLLSCSIVGVRQDLIARMETTGDLDIAHMFRKTTGTPAQTDAGDDLNVDSTTYKGSAAVLEDDPNTATDWDVTDLDSYQHGARNDG